MYEDGDHIGNRRGHGERIVRSADSARGAGGDADRRAVRAGATRGWQRGSGWQLQPVVGVLASARAQGSRGVWTIVVQLPPGEHLFMYVVDGTQWISPPLRGLCG